MKFKKGTLLVQTSNNIIDITNIYKKIVSPVALFVVFILSSSIFLSSILVHYEEKIIKKEISSLKIQKENISLVHSNLEKDVLKIINEKKEKRNLREIAQKLNPNIDNEFLNLWVDIIYKSQKDIEESLNYWSKIKLSQTTSPFALKPGSAMILAVVAIESNFDINAVSEKGAYGVFQIVTNTADELGLKDPRNPVENIYGGVRYLTYLLNKYKDHKDQLQLAFASYNAGPSRVTNEWIPIWGYSWSSIDKGLSASRKSYRETREYSVLAYQLTKLFLTGNWINKNDSFWINYRNQILAESKDDYYSMIF